MRRTQHRCLCPPLSRVLPTNAEPHAPDAERQMPHIHHALLLRDSRRIAEDINRTQNKGTPHGIPLNQWRCSPIRPQAHQISDGACRSTHAPHEDHGRIRTHGLRRLRSRNRAFEGAFGTGPVKSVAISGFFIGEYQLQASRAQVDAAHQSKQLHKAIALLLPEEESFPHLPRKQGQPLLPPSSAR